MKPGLIQYIGTQIDGATVDYLQAVFTAAADPVRKLTASVGLVALLFIALNHVLQIQKINYSTYLSWAMTYILVVSFATLWSNFSPVYGALTGVTQGYSNLLLEVVAKDIEALRPEILDPARISRADGEAKTYAAMDEFGHAILWIAWDFLHADFSLWHLGRSLRNIVLGGFVFFVGGVFVASCMAVVLIAKAGLIMAVSMAPLGITMFIWERTRQYFQNWVSLLIGFAIIPLLLGCLMAIVLYLAGHLLAETGPRGASNVRFFGFVFFMIAVLALLFQLPTMAQTLASASVAVGGASLAHGLAVGLPHHVIRKGVEYYRKRNERRRNENRSGGEPAAPNGAGGSATADQRSQFAALCRHSNDRKESWRRRRHES
ncbi:type IV secretion system protein [Sinorhizobium medicae]|uniref:type IV secretion system protein n=1 Tax=Sinorhizobium medicae TaxID=110321 RepID=UPI001309FBD3|nr:conjugal transfer protein [Sinorhizobium medicae]